MHLCSMFTYMAQSIGKETNFHKIIEYLRFSFIENSLYEYCFAVYVAQKNIWRFAAGVVNVVMPDENARWKF